MGLDLNKLFKAKLIALPLMCTYSCYLLISFNITYKQLHYTAIVLWSCVCPQLVSPSFDLELPNLAYHVGAKDSRNSRQGFLADHTNGRAYVVSVCLSVVCDVFFAKFTIDSL